MYEFIEEQCKTCEGLGKHSRDNKFPCWKCKGNKTIKRNIVPLDDQFCEGGLKYATEQFECVECEKEWHLSDTCEAETGDYERDLYQCTCGTIMELSTEWQSEYHIANKLYKGNLYNE